MVTNNFAHLCQYQSPTQRVLYEYVPLSCMHHNVVFLFLVMPASLLRMMQDGWFDPDIKPASLDFQSTLPMDKVRNLMALMYSPDDPILASLKDTFGNHDASTATKQAGPTFPGQRSSDVSVPDQDPAIPHIHPDVMPVQDMWPNKSLKKQLKAVSDIVDALTKGLTMTVSPQYRPCMQLTLLPALQQDGSNTGTASVSTTSQGTTIKRSKPMRWFATASSNTEIQPTQIVTEHDDISSDRHHSGQQGQDAASDLKAKPCQFDSQLPYDVLAGEGHANVSSSLSTPMTTVCVVTSAHLEQCSTELQNQKGVTVPTRSMIESQGDGLLFCEIGASDRHPTGLGDTAQTTAGTLRSLNNHDVRASLVVFPQGCTIQEIAPYRGGQTAVLLQYSHSIPSPGSPQQTHLAILPPPRLSHLKSWSSQGSILHACLREGAIQSMDAIHAPPEAQQDGGDHDQSEEQPQLRSRCIASANMQGVTSTTSSSWQHNYSHLCVSASRGLAMVLLGRSKVKMIDLEEDEAGGNDDDDHDTEDGDDNDHDTEVDNDHHSHSLSKVGQVDADVYESASDDSDAMQECSD